TAAPGPDDSTAAPGPDGAEPTTSADDGAPPTENLGEVGAGTSRPYLRGLPDGYAVDLLVMEWLEYLVVEAGPAGSRAAIGYYEDIEWLDAAAADALRAFLPGITPSADAAASTAGGDAPAADADGTGDDEFVWVADAADGDADEGLETTAEVDLTEYEADVERPGAMRTGPTARAGGAGRASLAADGAPPSLTPEHHRRSLAYISRIADDQQATTLIEHWDGGEPDGV
ncbi:MAG: FlaD/FlaE family flagellar protein, partial [Halobacteriaceae archaeon]